MVLHEAVTNARTPNVAQICNLPYRRIAFGSASEIPSRFWSSPAPQIKNLRYGTKLGAKDGGGDFCFHNSIQFLAVSTTFSCQARVKGL
jgi:hypothetical protein